LLAFNTDFPIKANAFLDCQFLNQCLKSPFHIQIPNNLYYIIGCRGHIPFVVHSMSVLVNSTGKERIILD
jgi:hypothetical protein